MYCTKCGTKNTETAKFCSNCATPIGVTSHQTDYTEKQTQIKKQYHYAEPHKRSGFRPYHLLMIFAGLNIAITLLGGMSMLFQGETEVLITTPASIIGGLIFFAIYYTPTLIGGNRSNGWAIFWLNFLLGWTCIGWVVVFIMSISYDGGKRLESIETTIRNSRP